MNTPFTFNVELANKPDRTGRHAVMIRIHQKQQKPGRVLTSVKILNPAKFWNADAEWGKWVVRHPDRTSLNTDIENEYDRVKNQAKQWQAESPHTPAMLAARFRGNLTTNYAQLLDHVVADAKDRAYATYLTKRSSRLMFTEWAGEDLPLEGVTESLVIRYREYLKSYVYMSGETRKRLSPGTINKYIERMHTLHVAVLEKTGVAHKKAEQLSPWLAVDSLPVSKKRRVKLSEETIQKLALVEVETSKRTMKPVDAFKIWMLQHALAGMRISDLLTLRYEHFETDAEGRPFHLKYEMMKTGNIVSVPVLEQGWHLLKSYWKVGPKPADFVLPYLKNSAAYSSIRNHEQYKSAPFEVRRRLYNALQHRKKQLNASLKELEQEAGLPYRLTTHISRHSFAALAKRIMKEDANITLFDIQLLLGHSQQSTTETYYREDGDEDSTRPMNMIFNRKKTNVTESK